MSGNKAVLDTNVVIFISKQQIDIDKLLSLYDEFYVSIVTYMEVYGFEFENEGEKALIDDFFEMVEIVSVNMSIAKKVVAYKKSKRRKIKGCLTIFVEKLPKFGLCARLGRKLGKF